jgi:hypothetical protein
MDFIGNFYRRYNVEEADADIYCPAVLVREITRQPGVSRINNISSVGA